MLEEFQIKNKTTLFAKSPEVVLLAFIANYEYNNQFRAHVPIYFNPWTILKQNGLNTSL